MKGRSAVGLGSHGLCWGLVMRGLGLSRGQGLGSFISPSWGHAGTLHCGPECHRADGRAVAELSCCVCGAAGLPAKPPSVLGRSPIPQSPALKRLGPGCGWLLSSSVSLCSLRNLATAAAVLSEGVRRACWLGEAGAWDSSCHLLLVHCHPLQNWWECTGQIAAINLWCTD